MEYVVFYDILKSWSGAEYGTLVLLMGALLGIFLLLKSIKRRKIIETIFVSIWIIGWVCLGSVGFGNVYYQHFRCSQWARSGDYQTIEGPIEYFEEYSRGEGERFSVGNVHFEYSSFNLSVCGFKQLVSEGSPIKNGLQVRIAYKDGRILKLEIVPNQ